MARHRSCRWQIECRLWARRRGESGAPTQSEAYTVVNGEKQVAAWSESISLAAIAWSAVAGPGSSKLRRVATARRDMQIPDVTPITRIKPLLVSKQSVLQP